MRRRYKTVKLPEEMVDAIEQLLKEHPEYGFFSVAEFMKDSVRHHCHRYASSVKPEKGVDSSTRES
jgi:Arc/MetJ-type ribon-helix-helix transcriptional regulator